jgi:hypothetical protein
MQKVLFKTIFWLAQTIDIKTCMALVANFNEIFSAEGKPNF